MNRFLLTNNRARSGNIFRFINHENIQNILWKGINYHEIYIDVNTWMTFEIHVHTLLRN